MASIHKGNREHALAADTLQEKTMCIFPCTNPRITSNMTVFTYKIRCSGLVQNFEDAEAYFLKIQNVLLLFFVMTMTSLIVHLTLASFSDKY